MNAEDLSYIVNFGVNTGLWSRKAYAILSLLNKSVVTLNEKGLPMKKHCVFIQHDKHPDDRIVLDMQSAEDFSLHTRIVQSPTGEALIKSKNYLSGIGQSDILRRSMLDATIYGLDDIRAAILEHPRAKERSRVTFYLESGRVDTSAKQLLCLESLLVHKTDESYHGWTGAIGGEWRRSAGSQLMSELIGDGPVNVMKSEPLKIIQTELGKVCADIAKTIVEDVCAACRERAGFRIVEDIFSVKSVADFRDKFVAVAKQIADEKTCVDAARRIACRLLDVTGIWS